MAARAAATGAESCVSCVSKLNDAASRTGSLGLKSQVADCVVLGIVSPVRDGVQRLDVLAVTSNTLKPVRLRGVVFCNMASRRRRGASRGARGACRIWWRWAAAARRARLRGRAARRRARRRRAGAGIEQQVRFGSEAEKRGADDSAVLPRVRSRGTPL